jgi:hypothetical protein
LASRAGATKFLVEQSSRSRTGLLLVLFEQLSGAGEHDWPGILLGGEGYRNKMGNARHARQGLSRQEQIGATGHGSVVATCERALMLQRLQRFLGRLTRQVGTSQAENKNGSRGYFQIAFPWLRIPAAHSGPSPL